MTLMGVPVFRGPVEGMIHPVPDIPAGVAVAADVAVAAAEINLNRKP